MIRALLRDPVLCQAYASAWHDPVLRMEALVVACDVVDAETRSRVYRMLQTLFPDWNYCTTTVYCLMFHVACRTDRFRVVLNLMDHPDVWRHPGDDQKSMWEIVWDDVVLDGMWSEQLRVIERRISENVLRILWSRHEYDEYTMVNVVQNAEQWIFKWIFNRLSASQLTSDVLEGICDELLDCKKMKDDAVAIQTWVLRHESSRTVAVTTMLLRILAKHPLFIDMLHRSIAYGCLRLDLHTLFYQLRWAPASHLRAFLCSVDKNIIHTFNLRRWFDFEMPSPELLTIVLDDVRFKLFDSMVYAMMFMTNMTSDVFVTALRHPRVKEKQINFYTHASFGEHCNEELYEMLFEHPLYCPSLEESWAMLRRRQWDLLCLMMTDTRINTAETREDLLYTARLLDEEAALMAQPFMRVSKKIKITKK